MIPTTWLAFAARIVIGGMAMAFMLALCKASGEADEYTTHTGPLTEKEIAARLLRSGKL